MALIPHADYQLTIPESWRDASVVMFSGPANDGFGPTVTVGREEVEEEITLEQYADNLLPLLRKTFAEHGFELVEESSTQLNGLPAIRRRYDCALKKQPITQVQYYLIQNQVAYVITLSDRQNRFRKAADTMRAIAESFEIA